MAKGKTSGKEITVTGFIEEYEDESGNYGLQLVSSDEEFIIEIDRVAKGLRDLLGEEVEVTGMVTKNKEGFKQLKVVSFELLESDDDDYDDSDYDYDSKDDDRY